MMPKRPTDIFTAGATSGVVPGHGGYGGYSALVKDHSGIRMVEGSEVGVTSYRMQIKAVIEGLRILSPYAPVRVFNHNKFLVLIMNGKLNRKAEKVLYEQLESLIKDRHSEWYWVSRSAGPYMREVQSVARRQARELADIESFRLMHTDNTQETEGKIDSEVKKQTDYRPNYIY